MLPQLKSFLHDGEAVHYEGVEIEYIHGRKAILTIYRDGQEQEQVTLSDYKTKEEMHALMVEKGFIRKSQEEIEELMSWFKFQKEEASRIRFEEKQRAERNWRQDEVEVRKTSKKPISDMEFL